MRDGTADVQLLKKKSVYSSPMQFRGPPHINLCTAVQDMNRVGDRDALVRSPMSHEFHGAVDGAAHRTPKHACVRRCFAARNEPACVDQRK
jgi:hypothetical protein